MVGFCEHRAEDPGPLHGGDLEAVTETVREASVAHEPSFSDRARLGNLSQRPGASRRVRAGRALRTWAKRIDAARGDAYACFNNDWEGFAVANARTLQRLLDAY
jgi:uncharacterized protein YecE (DUF72 family)